MDRIRWVEKSITFRNLTENPAIQKPALVQIGTKSFIVGEKLRGKFLVASLCKVSNNRSTVLNRDIILSRKHDSIWKVISKSRSQNENFIHRLTTKDIETIYQKDLKNERATPRTYVCTREIEAFELRIRQNDPDIINGQRIDRHKKYISENVEFKITDIGEVEYTPREGERTSQDFISTPKAKSEIFLQFFLPNMTHSEQLIRNRVLRTLHCTTVNEARKRHFLLEVNEQPCDIRPIAAEGSTELRYLQSTQNLFDYMSHYGNDTLLCVKLMCGDVPIKSIASDGYLVFKHILNGDQIPLCCIDDLEVFLFPSNVSVRVKLPTNDSTWDSLPEIRAAQVQCMQLSLALLARHESEMYVTTDLETNDFDLEEEKLPSISPADVRVKQMQPETIPAKEQMKLPKQSAGRPPKGPIVAEKLNRNSTKRIRQNKSNDESTRLEPEEKLR